MITIHQGVDAAKNLAAVFGVTSVLWGAYSVSGLPVPATLHQVELRISEVSKRLDGLTSDQLKGQRSVIQLTRVSLRQEQTALQRLMESGLDLTTRTTLTQRLAEIGDQLADLDANDSELRSRITNIPNK